MIKDYRILVVLTAIILAIVGASVHKAMQADYVKYQKEYYKLAGVKEFTVEINQLNVKTPNGTLIDRCQTCHIGAANKDAKDFKQPLKQHPNVVPGMMSDPHEFGKMGCVVCHEGNGRGLEQEDAHGELAFWTTPLLKARMVQASCSKCHDIEAKDLKGADLLNKGKRLYIERACWACHTIEGVSTGTKGPNLSSAGTKFQVSYLRESIVEPTANINSSKMPKFNWVASEDDVKALVVYLKAQRSDKFRDQYKTPVEYQPKKAQAQPTLKTASIEAGREIFRGHSVRGAVRGGCANCHTVRENDGKRIGGNVGPELTYVYRARGLDYALKHIRNPAADTIDTVMPKFDMLSSIELESLTKYLGSLTYKSPSSKPADIYKNYCMSCHGDDLKGRGELHALLDPLPRDLSRAQFVATYQKRFTTSIKEGIPGTAMPPWKRIMNDTEVKNLIGFIVDKADPEKVKKYERIDVKLPKVGDFENDWGPNDPKRKIEAPDAARGRAHYGKFCTGCHGKLANGKGPNAYDLNHLPRNLLNMQYMKQRDLTDERLYKSILLGVPDTPMPAHDRVLSDQAILDVIAFLRTLTSETKENAE